MTGADQDRGAPAPELSEPKPSAEALAAVQRYKRTDEWRTADRHGLSLWSDRQVARLLDAHAQAARADRDRLWCRALMNALDLDEADAVLTWFNRNRPSALAARYREEARRGK